MHHSSSRTEKTKGKKKKNEEIVPENFPNWMKYVNIDIQKAS